MITIYTLTYNEEIKLPFFIKHYRDRFPNCNIVIFDNESTDKTVEIANSNDCEVITYSTNNRILDSKYLQIKNNCWKNSKTDWNIICDCDELCEINKEDLEFEIQKGTTIFEFEGYDMVNTSTNKDSIVIEQLNMGVRNEFYDKMLMFNKQEIYNINYFIGCHNSFPDGNVKFSTKKYKLLHYKYIGENYLVNRYKSFSIRLSEENLQKRWGYHYNQDEKKIRDYFNLLKSKSINIL